MYPHVSLVQCEYNKDRTIAYFDSNLNKLVIYECQQDERGKHYCMFHDEDYAKNNPIDVMDSFHTLIDDAIKTAKPLLCIGFNLTGEVDLKNKTFKDIVYFSFAKFTKKANFSYAKFTQADFLGAEFIREADFIHATFAQKADFSQATFAQKANFSFTTFAQKADFNRTDFVDEVIFQNAEFPSHKSGQDLTDIPIQFHYCTFRKRVQFIGEPEKDKPLELGLVSFKGVDLSNVYFYNVRWLQTEKHLEGLAPRYRIIDEELLNKNQNYEDVSNIYNQLRKNYESRLLFNAASNFFIGEMEAKRKSLWNGTPREKMATMPYSLYKILALYGESMFLPTVIWTPIGILSFTAFRYFGAICSVPIPHGHCSIIDQLVDSFAAYFQFPRSTTNIYDTVERILSIPVLGTAFIAIRRKFERIK